MALPQSPSSLSVESRGVWLNIRLALGSVECAGPSLIAVLDTLTMRCISSRRQTF